MDENLTVNRKIGIELRKTEESRYRLMWEIENTLSIMEEIPRCEYIWYIRSGNYDVAVEMGIIVYNLVVMVNKMSHREKRKIMDVVT